MRMPINHFKKALQNKQRQIGIFLGLADAYSAEVLATVGFDWLLIDAEHGPNDMRSIREQLQVLAAYPENNVVVRLPDHNAAVIKRALDMGAQSIMIPMVENAQQAQQLVKAIRYPQNGIRGVGTAMARAARWNSVDDYFVHADAEMCLIVQIETLNGLKHLQEICAVDGVDGVFIGPSDLAASMGYLGNPNHPDVKKAVTEGIQIITSHGKAAGVFSASAGTAQEYEHLGANFMMVGVDVLLLRKAACELAQTFSMSNTGRTSADY